MEKRTFLAIVLSFIVLFGYEVIFIAPKRIAAKSTQTIVNKDVTNVSTATDASGSINPTETTSKQIKAEISKIETSSNQIELSNVGASLHKVSISNFKPMPLVDILTVKGYENTSFSSARPNADTTVYDFADANVHITKTFKRIDEHSISATIEISNLSKTTSLENISFNGFSIDTSNLPPNNRETMLDEYSTLLVDGKVSRKSNAFQFNPKESKTINSPIQWVGFRDHYSAFLVKPEFGTKGYETTVVGKNRFNMAIMPQTVTLAPGTKANYTFTLFAGPQDITVLKKYGNGVEKIVAFSNFGIIDVIAKAIYWTIPFIHGIVKSWGLSIICMGLIIYGITYPLTFKSMMSMRKMQAAQPKIAALKEKYKNDAAKMQSEMIEIYRREKINPLGGCLPMILQMPFFMAIYQVLWRAYYFQGKSFLWIKDLAQPDRLFIMPFSLPFLGNEFNILPILMAIVMFFQQKLSAKSAVIVDEAQAAQQKMMSTIFPVFIGFIFYKFASSLALYFTMFYLLSTLTQWKMSKVKV